MADLAEMVGGQVDFVERKDLTPICPHCDAGLSQIYTQGKGITIAPPGRTVIYFCPNCSRVLGVAQGYRTS